MGGMAHHPLAAVAEDLVASLPTPADGHRLDRPWGVLRHAGRHGRDFCNVARVRLDPHDVEAAVAEAREWFGGLGQPEHAWWLGPSAQPGDLEARLRAAGLVPDPVQPTSTAMVLTSPPDVPDRPGLEVRALGSADELRSMLEIDAAVWGLTAEDRAHVFRDVDEHWERISSQPGRTTYLAWLDGEPAAYGSLVLLPEGAGALLGGSTRPEARGRGLYQALVRARWEAAHEAGMKGLVVQASDMSRPVLQRLGFRPTGLIRLWAHLERRSR
jgi:GNAT superfamily N-acetyltransferase